MSKYAVCPKYVEYCVTKDPAQFCDILMGFVQSNKNKIVVDSKRNIIEEYSKVDNHHGFLSTWLNLLVSREAKSIYYVHLDNHDHCDVKGTIISLAKKINSRRTIIANDEDDYHAYKDAISEYNISVIDVSNALNCVRHSDTFDISNFTSDLISQLMRLMERKKADAIEDLHNDRLCDYLRTLGYSPYDQTRSGSSAQGTNPGELDMMIRGDKSQPETIIEALRLKSCGKKNKEVSEHIYKLLHCYDAVGLPRNFIIIYSEAKNFQHLWNNYQIYIKDLNNKNAFLAADFKLESFKDATKNYTKVADMRVGISNHKRNDISVEVMHLFVNMKN